jgi:hypothetical protein
VLANRHLAFAKDFETRAGTLVALVVGMENSMDNINKPQFGIGFVVMVRDRGQDAPRMVNKLYPDHVAATCVKHNLQDTGRYNGVYVREATLEDVAKIGE